MKLTNRLGLPEPIVQAVANDDYDRGDADISVTQLIQPPRKVELERRHATEIVEDACDRIWSLVGQIAHGILERASRTGIAERRVYAEVGGWRISGKTDRLDIVGGEGGYCLTDWKVTSSWGVKDGPKEEWEQQLNAYAHLLRANGYDVRELKIIAILRDWSKLEAKRSRDYPQRQVAVLPVRLWSADYTQHWISQRVYLHRRARIELPDCTDEERWHRGEKWAVYRNDNKTATKLCVGESEAAAFVTVQTAKDRKPQKYRIEHRPGESIRCASYCNAAPFCSQWKALQSKEIPNG